MPTTDSNTDDMSQAAVQVTSQSGNDERGTPTQFIRQLHNAIGGLFDLDPCSGAEPQRIARTRFTKEDNGLAQDWTGYDTVYVNPPYSDLKTWLQKVEREATRDDPAAPSLVLCLLPGNTSTQWFQKYATKGEYLCLIEGRLTFHGTDRNAPFASILIAFGNPDDDVLETLHSLGTLYTKAEVEQASKQSRLTDLLETDGGGVAEAPAADLPSPAAPGNPLSNHGPTIRDVSQAAPAVPQGFIDFYDVAINDEFYLALDDTTIGFPEFVPTSANIRILSGEPATNRNTQTPEQWHTLLGIDEATETYFCLLQNPRDATDIRCSAAPNGRGWIDVTIDTLNRVHTDSSVPAIEPYGDGTSFIAPVA